MQGRWRLDRAPALAWAAGALAVLAALLAFAASPLAALLMVFAALACFWAAREARRYVIAPREEQIELVGLAERGKHRPAELSGGQQQRVAIARAIVSDPTLLICDEPTGDLDRASAEEILGLLQMLNRDHGKTIVMVTHDPKAAEYATHTLHLDKGTLVEQVTHAA